MEERDYCPFCGGEIVRGARKCKHCAEFLDENIRRTRADEALVEEPPPNGVAIAAVALGAATFFTAGLTAIPAIICGIIGMGNAKEHPSRPGYGLAVAGLVLGILGVLILLTVVAVLIPLFLSGLPVRLLEESSATTNLIAVNSAASSFHLEKGRYPESFRDIMENMGVIPERWNNDNSFIKQGYTFTYFPRFKGGDVVDYVIVASPSLTPNLKARTLIITPLGELRWMEGRRLPTDYETAKRLYERSNTVDSDGGG